MKAPVTIALDAMGGDHGPDVVVPAALEILGRYADVSLVLVGDRDELERRCGDRLDALGERLSIRHTTQTVGMDESPATALRGKKDSSMRVAIDLVKKGEADACVSAGNTGALMATARFVLKTLPGIDRPAIISAIPSVRGHTHVLDLGANVDLDAGQLFQLAVMGATLVRAVDNIDRPRIGLLNVGEEEIKGNEEVKQAHTLLSATDLNYIGFVEGNDVYTGDVDVIVCDGFVGNVALKTSEGLAHMISQFMREAFNRNVLTRTVALAAAPVLSSFKRRIDPRRYNGASLVGLQGIVIKSHGGADAFAFAHAIDIARIEVAKAVPQTIGEEIGHLLEATGTA